MQRTSLFLLALVGLSFFLRVYKLGDQELRGDEAFSWNYIQSSPLEILDRIVREGDPQPPLHYWTLWAWAQLNGDSEFALRFPSVFFSLLLVPLMFQVGRRLFDQKIGLLAAGLTAIHPQQIWFAQDARNMYLLALVGILAATWLLPSLLQKHQIKAWIAYVASGLMAMFSHYYAVLPLIAHGSYVYTAQATRGALWRWLSAGLLIAILVAPWAIIIIPIYAHGQLAEPGNLSLANYATAVLNDLTAGPAYAKSTQDVITIIILLIAFIPLFAGKTNRLYLLLAIIIPFFGIYAIIGLRSTFNAYYFVFAFPAMFLLVADGLSIIMQKWRLVGLLIIAVGIITYTIGLQNHYFGSNFSKTRGIRSIAAYITQTRLPGDGYLANFPDPVQGYYLRHLAIPYQMLPASPNFKLSEIDSALTALDYKRIWFVPLQSNQWDSDAAVRTHLLDNYILAEDEQYNKMELMLFVPIQSASHLNASFAEGIELNGYYLSSSRLTLIWSVTTAPSADYTIFVHALSANGTLIAQHDASPVRPTSTWRLGETILDSHPITIPSDGSVTLSAGLYLPATGQRLTLLAGQPAEANAALIATP